MKAPTVYLDSEQLLIEALHVFLANKKLELPVYSNGEEIGVLRLKDLVAFLVGKKSEKNLFAHRLCFQISSAMSMFETNPGYKAR